MSTVTIRTPLPDAGRVAAAVGPDNTPEMSTTVENGAVVTTIDRDTAAGLRSTFDDYIVNVELARAVGALADRRAADDSNTDTPTDRHTDTPTDRHTDTPTDRYPNP